MIYISLINVYWNIVGIGGYRGKYFFVCEKSVLYMQNIEKCVYEENKLGGVVVSEYIVLCRTTHRTQQTILERRLGNILVQKDGA